MSEIDKNERSTGGDKAVISDEELLELNKEGLIPGPTETEAGFVRRVFYCHHLKERMGSLLEAGDESCSLEDLAFAQRFLDEAYPVTIPLFDIAPHWIPLFFSNRKLAFWHGGCAWIFQEKEDSPTAAIFQLRKTYHRAKTYLGLYSRSELIAHELAHVGRMMFQEPRFEEMLAYQTSPSSFRRWLGPIVKSSREALYFILSLGLMVGIAFLTPKTHGNLRYILLGLQTIPWFLVAYAFFRLQKNHRLFTSCLARLKEVFGDEKAEAILYRLTDDEIVRFGEMKSDDMRSFVETARHQTLRWRVIALAYINPT